MFPAIEKFATDYRHTVELMSAIGTCGAVVVSLMLAFFASRAARTRLKARANMIVVVRQITSPSVLAVTITNVGNMPLFIPGGFFYWKTPLMRGYMQILSMDMWRTAHFPQKAYPVEILPRNSTTFYVSDEATMISEAKRTRPSNSVKDWWRRRFIRASVFTSDGMMFRVKLDGEVRKVWRGNRGNLSGDLSSARQGHE